ncbi:hypothetical protein VNO80_06636 [Phaseolus coccineus]|uniref:Uncharacterized protein n=1 Tax=Phaseolus coccineus TaxID=3886 RepID=A0AAN9NM08_PHACN
MRASPGREACGHRRGARHAGIAGARGMRASPGREACGHRRGARHAGIAGARGMRASPGREACGHRQGARHAGIAGARGMWASPGLDIGRLPGTLGSFHVSGKAGEGKEVIKDASPPADSTAEDTKLNVTRIHDVDYAWVDVGIREYFSKYMWTWMLKSFIGNVDLLDDEAVDGVISLVVIDLGGFENLIDTRQAFPQNSYSAAFAVFMTSISPEDGKLFYKELLKQQQAEPAKPNHAQVEVVKPL